MLCKCNRFGDYHRLHAQQPIYVQRMGDDEQSNKTLQGLKSSSGFIKKKELARRLNLEILPELKFVLDGVIGLRHENGLS